MACSGFDAAAVGAWIRPDPTPPRKAVWAARIRDPGRPSDPVGHAVRVEHRRDVLPPTVPLMAFGPWGCLSHGLPTRASEVMVEQRRKSLAVVFGISSNTLVRSSLSSSGPAGGASEGWDKKLRARTAGVRLPRPGHSESWFKTVPSICPVMLRHRYRYGTE